MDTLNVLAGSPLAGLPMLRNATSRRASSWDRTGGNDDRLHIQPGERRCSPTSRARAVVRHIWVTIACDEPDFLRKIVLQAWWDGEETPSIEVPVGDFFGVGHAQTRNFSAAAAADESRRTAKRFNCWFPMPFAPAARITATSECRARRCSSTTTSTTSSTTRSPDGLGYFHAQWRRENPTDGMRTRAIDQRASTSSSGENIDRRRQLRDPRGARAAATTSAAT